jgi:hypothetical protein
VKGLALCRTCNAVICFVRGNVFRLGSFRPAWHAFNGKRLGGTEVKIRILIRSVGAVLSALVLSQCTPPGYAAELISGDPQQVAIKAGHYANPGPIASEHCAKFGKTAVLQEANGSIYKFTCQSSAR